MLILSYPSTISLELISACNNRCQGCSNVYAENRSSQSLPAQQWINWLAEFGPEVAQIRLTGGEPTLHPEFNQIFTAATSYNAGVTIFTNGRWINPQRLFDSIKGNPHLNGLLVSLHGATPDAHEFFSHVKGSFDETVRNIQLAVDEGLRIAISTVLTRQSIHQIKTIVDLGQNLGVTHIAFNRYIGAPDKEIEPEETDFRKAINEIESLRFQGANIIYGVGIPLCFSLNSSEGCLAGAAYAAIDPWGKVRPCSHSPTIIGSLQENSLFNIWHGKEMEIWRKKWMPVNCADCGAYSRCHGGCRAVQELRMNARDPLRRDPLPIEPEMEIKTRQLPGHIRPVSAFRIRTESFGFVLFGAGGTLPVRTEARPLLDACDGSKTITELYEEFGQAGLNLLGDMFEKGMLKE
jgi:radical SAM protein with 4Fe4S-binding SPASM domain